MTEEKIEVYCVERDCDIRGLVCRDLDPSFPCSVPSQGSECKNLNKDAGSCDRGNLILSAVAFHYLKLLQCHRL